MTYDVFPFFNELELLELRLHELDAVVDRFVVIEATHTHSGLPKPLHFAQNRALFHQFDSKLIHVPVEEPFEAAGRLKFVDFQRNAMQRALGGCRPDDVIMLSDIDEIPRQEKVRETVQALPFDRRPAAEVWHRLLKQPAVIWTFRNFFKKRHPFVWLFHHKYFIYFLNCAREERLSWPGTRLVHYRDFSSGRDLRRWGGHPVANGGWHFTYLGGVERIQAKLASFSHTELNTPEFNNTARISQAIQQGKHIVSPNCPLHFEQIDHSYPKYLRENLPRFSALIRDEPA